MNESNRPNFIDMATRIAATSHGHQPDVLAADTAAIALHTDVVDTTPDVTAPVDTPRVVITITDPDTTPVAAVVPILNHDRVRQPRSLVRRLVLVGGGIAAAASLFVVGTNPSESPAQVVPAATAAPNNFDAATTVSQEPTTTAAASTTMESSTTLEAASSSSSSSSTSSTTSEAAPVTAAPVVLTGDVVANASEQTDETLRTGNFKCGGELDATSTDEFSYKIPFFQGNEKLGKSYMDNLVTDPTWGMGAEAFAIYKKFGIVNGTTRDKVGAETSGNDDLNAYIKGVFSFDLVNKETFVNGDCRNAEDAVTMPSPDIPVIIIGGHDAQGNPRKSTVEGIVLPAAAFAEWEKVATHDADGNLTFRVIKFKSPDANGVDQEFVFIVTAANGCDNPIRITHIPPKQPPTPPASPSPTTRPPKAPPTTPPGGTSPPTTSGPPTTPPGTTGTTRPEVTAPASVPIQGPGDGGDPDPNNNPNDNTSVVTTAPAPAATAPGTTATAPATSTPPGTFNG